MRIAFLSHAYPRWEGDPAGAFIERLARSLVRRGHHVTAVVPADRGVGGGEVVAGVHVERVRYAPAPLERLAHRGTMVREAATPWGAAALVALVHRLARAVEPEADVVHAHWWVPAGLAAHRARARGAPAPVVTLHGTDVRLLDRLPGASALARRVLRGAASVTAVSTHLAARAAHLLGRPLSEVAVIPMPVSLDGLPDQPATTRTGVVAVARLTRQKRLDLAIRAVAELAVRGRPLQLTIVGDGPDRRRLERLAGRLGMSSVHFTGYVAPRDVTPIVSRAAVAVVPSRAEGFGLAAAEALMCGVPVIAATDGGGVCDVVPRDGPGRRAPPNDPGSWADAIETLADSPEARQLAWEAGRDWRDRLAPDAVAARFEVLYGA